jgi:hypothetical protein
MGMVVMSKRELSGSSSERPCLPTGDILRLGWTERGRQLRRLLGVGRAVAGSAVKVTAVLGFDNLKTKGNAVRSHSPRLAIGHRKRGSAGLAALRTSKIFNPMVAGCHRYVPSPETFLCR